MSHDDDNFDALLDLLEQKDWDALRRALRRMDPADLADFIEEISSEDRDLVFAMFDLETASDVLVELEANVLDDVVEDLPHDHIADLAEQMAPDEAADFIADMDEDQAATVLAAMEPEERQEVSELLRYEEDSAGHIMTPEILAQPGSSTVKETIDLLAAIELSDPVFNVYVTDPVDERLIGLITVSELLAADPEKTLGDVADRDYVSATTDEDQEDIARRFRKYDLWVMPVVDADHRLVGRITVDDVMDVLHEEADEDLARMVGAPDIEEDEESLVAITRMRLPWLMITMCAGLANSIIIKTMMSATEVVAIAIFVPAILAMGGNTGMQSSAICIRGIALGEKKYGRLFGIVWREVRVGITLGIICGICTACMVWGGLTWGHADTGGIPPIRLAIIVGAAMANAMAFASSYGAMVPIILHRLRVDPAVASGPFITTSNDLSASMIYFLTCLLMLKAG